MINLFEYNQTAYESAAAMLFRNGYTLGRWYYEQKKKLADGKLNERQIGKLSEISVEFQKTVWKGIIMFKSLKEERERCVLCGRLTEYTEDNPISERTGYIEGSGQLCRTCYAGLYENKNSELKIKTKI